MAVLMTCHNRKEETVRCLDRLFDQTGTKGILVEVFLVDAGSTDGTVDVVYNKYPGVRVFRKFNSLYWNAGMRLAWGESAKDDFDYYLWLNDDVALERDALQRLLTSYDETVSRKKIPAIIVGSFSDPTTGQITYGGWKRRDSLFLRFTILPAGDNLFPCDAMNGNLVLVPREIFLELGNLDDRFSHSMGDFDYGLRAKAIGYPCMVAPGYFGTCSRNEEAGTWTDPSLPLKERVQLMNTPKGLPLKEWVFFTKRHAPLTWPYYFVTANLRALFPDLWRKRSGTKRT